MATVAPKPTKVLSLRLVFAQNLRAYRIHKGVSQERLADEAGLDRAFVGTLERGQRNISVDNIELLCDAVGMPAHELLDPSFLDRNGLDPAATRSPRTARPYPPERRPRATK